MPSMLALCWCTAEISCLTKRILNTADAYPTSSAPLINSYLAANGIIMGKAALDELQDGGNSVNPTNQYEYGLITTMLNAYNQTRIAGGNSHITIAGSPKVDHREAWAHLKLSCW